MYIHNLQKSDSNHKYFKNLMTAFLEISFMAKFKKKLFDVINCLFYSFYVFIELDNKFFENKRRFSN